MEPLIRRATDADAPSVARLFLRSFKTTYPSFREVHTDAETANWIATEVIPGHEAWVAESTTDGVVGWMVVAPGELEHLYLAPEWLGRGLGDRFMALAKERQPTGLRLYTFQVNTRACRFYERHGFTVVDLNDGSRNEEGEPDVQYRWVPGLR
jgi:ribosomal protein S18 acetylase RimI-like enzyme